MIKVKVTKPGFETYNKKDGSGTYCIQTAWAYTHDRNGIKEFPEELRLFVRKDEQGQPMPYAVGEYTVEPSSLMVNNGNLEIRFLSLRPLMQSADKKAS